MTVARTALTSRYRRATRALLASAGAAALAGAAARGAEAPAAPSDEYPIEITERLVFVDATVNGKAGQRFIVDTGASETIVHPRLAAETGILGLPVSPDYRRGDAASIAVGAAEVAPLTVFIGDPVQALPLRLNKGVDYQGILGYTFLSHFNVTIDYPRKRIRFEPRDPARPRAGRPPSAPAPSGAATPAIVVPFTVQGGQVYAHGKVNGAGPITFIVDTGSAEVLLLPDSARRVPLGLPPFAGKYGPAFALARDVSLGGAAATNVPLVIHAHFDENPLSSPYDGILGTPFLANFEVTFRYRDQKLLLRSPP